MSGSVDSRNSGGKSRQGPARSFFGFITGFDWVQILALAFLLTTGLVFIHSTGEQVGTAAARAFFSKQCTLWLPMGLGMWLLFALQDYRKFYFKAGGVAFYMLTTLLLALVLVKGVGVKVYGATRWLVIAGFRLQPSEFGKLSLVMLLAWVLSSSRFHGSRFSGIIAAFCGVMIPAVLIYKEPDFGGTMILFPIVGIMLFAAGLKWRWLLVFTVGISLLTGGFIINETKGKPLLKTYQRKRLQVFLNPGTDISNSGHNVYQSRLAVGSGGLHGKGIGEGTQHNLGFLPQTVSNNDFIFSVIGEETGFIGSLTLLGGYILLLYSILRTAFQAPPYGRLLAVGIGAIIFCHVYINIGMCIGLAPVTGLPLPFVSYGGSSMIVGMMMMGILQSIHRHPAEPVDEEK